MAYLTLVQSMIETLNEYDVVDLFSIQNTLTGRCDLAKHCDPCGTELIPQYIRNCYFRSADGSRVTLYASLGTLRQLFKNRGYLQHGDMELDITLHLDNMKLEGGLL